MPATCTVGSSEVSAEVMTSVGGSNVTIALMLCVLVLPNRLGVLQRAGQEPKTICRVITSIQEAPFSFSSNYPEQQVCVCCMQEAEWMLREGFTPETCQAGRGIGYQQAIDCIRAHSAEPENLKPADVVRSELPDPVQHT